MANNRTVTIGVVDDVVRSIPELRAALRLARAVDAVDYADWRYCQTGDVAERMAAFREHRAALEEWRRVSSGDPE